jgi:thiol-disulfide isomerase/thioredoxin
MKLLFSLFLTLFAGAAAMAQGIEFFHGTWDEALELSKSQGKPLFVDAYAKWCGPCKRMAATTFKNAEAGDYFNKNFINVKIDAEEGEGIKFRQKYPVTAFPTLYFIDENGEVIHQAVGAQNVKGLIKLGDIALSKVDYSREYAAGYDKGKREPEFILNYVRALNRSNKSSLRISNEYLRSQEDMTTEFNLRFILEATVEADSRIFGLLIKYQKEIGKLEGLQALRDRIKLACENTVQKAIDYKSPELLQEAKEKMKQNYPRQTERFAIESDMAYYKAMKDAKNYAKACDDYAKKIAKDDSGDMARVAEEILYNFSNDEKCMKQAEKYAKEAARQRGSFDDYYLYARVLLQNGKKKDALAAAQKCQQLSKEGNSKATHSVDMLIKMIEG